MRVTNHPVVTLQPRETVPFFFNDMQIEGLEGDTIATALWANKQRIIRYTEKQHEARSMFC